QQAGPPRGHRQGARQPRQLPLQRRREVPPGARTVRYRKPVQPTIDQFEGMIDQDGQQRQVTFFRVGRIALMYQTPDQDETGVWDADTQSWQVANEFRSDVSKGIRIAKKQAAIDILNLPIPAPEAAQ